MAEGYVAVTAVMRVAVVAVMLVTVVSALTCVTVVANVTVVAVVVTAAEAVVATLDSALLVVLEEGYVAAEEDGGITVGLELPEVALAPTLSLIPAEPLGVLSSGNGEELPAAVPPKSAVEKWPSVSPMGV